MKLWFLLIIHDTFFIITLLQSMITDDLAHGKKITLIFGSMFHKIVNAFVKAITMKT